MKIKRANKYSLILRTYIIFQESENFNENLDFYFISWVFKEIRDISSYKIVP